MEAWLQIHVLARLPSRMMLWKSAWWVIKEKMKTLRDLLNSIVCLRKVCGNNACNQVKSLVTSFLTIQSVPLTCSLPIRASLSQILANGISLGVEPGTLWGTCLPDVVGVPWIPPHPVLSRSGATWHSRIRFVSLHCGMLWFQIPGHETFHYGSSGWSVGDHPALRSQSSCSGNPPQHHKHLEARIPNAEMFCPIHPFFHVKKGHLAKQLVETKNVCFQSLCATVMPSKHLQFLDMGQAVLKEIFWEGRFSGAMLVLGRVINLRFGGLFSVRFQWCTPWKLFTYVGSNVSFHFET